MKKSINSLGLKWITVVMMSAGTVLERVISVWIAGDGRELSESVSLLYGMASVLYMMSFPIAAFLLVEGAVHTSDKRKFLCRLLLAALIAEVPLDLALNGAAYVRLWGYSQNYFFTLALGLSVIWAVEALAGKYKSGSMLHNLLTLGIYLLAASAANLLCLEQGSIGVLVIIALYLLRGNRMLSLVSVAALYILFMGNAGGLAYFPAAGLLLTWLYDDAKGGNKSKKMRILVYAAYPAVCCLFGLVTWLGGLY